MLLTVLRKFTANRSNLKLLNSRNLPKVVCCYCSSKNSNLEKTEKWTPIYKFRFIRIAAAFNKLKIYQGAMCTIGIPATFALEQSSHLPESSSVVAASVGVTMFITLSLGSFALKNLIGFIYLNENGDQVRLAFLDFWGRRKQIEMPTDQIVPPNEIVTTKWSTYQPVTTRTDGNIYKLSQRFGIITYPEVFSSIFGD